MQSVLPFRQGPPTRGNQSSSVAPATPLIDRKPVESARDHSRAQQSIPLRANGSQNRRQPYPTQSHTTRLNGAPWSCVGHPPRGVLPFQIWATLPLKEIGDGRYVPQVFRRDGALVNVRSVPSFFLSPVFSGVLPEPWARNASDRPSESCRVCVLFVQAEHLGTFSRLRSLLCLSKYFCS